MTFGPRAAFGRAFLVTLLAVATGCAMPARVLLPSVSPPAAELVATPFFPQQDHQCGPAALATVLGASGAAVHPDALVGEIYLPGRKGSLQLEIVAATRRHGRVPYVVAPRLDSVVEEVRSGHPVLVLVNQGPRFLPLWHYAVVVGYSTADDTLVLRSGDDPRRVLRASDFVRAWRRSDNWALVVLEPGRLPGSLDAGRYLAAVLDLERIGAIAPARDAYRALLDRDPDNRTALFGLGSTSQRLDDLVAAERAYRRLLSAREDDPAALNNLALVLAARGCIEAARATIARALEVTAANDSRSAALADSVREIESRADEGASGACTPDARMQD